MTIRLPEYEDEYLQEFTVCACVDAAPLTEHVIGLEAIATDRDIPVHAELTVNEQADPQGVHLHLETMRADGVEVEQDDLVPMLDLLSRIDGFLGKTMKIVRLFARFVVPLDQFPKDHVVRLLLDVAAARDESIRLSGATFSLNEGPVDQIHWRLSERDDGQELIVCDVRSTTEDVQITESCLADMLHDAHRAFESLILAETASAGKP